LSVKERQRLPSLAQLKHLPRFLSKKERRITLGALLLGLCALGGLGYRYLSDHQNMTPAVGGSYTEGVAGYPALINPLYASASDVDNDLAKLVYSGLMRFDPVDGIVPDLAESFSMSEDGKSYTFILRQDAKFHDGVTLTSEDVVFTIHAIQNPEYRSPLQSSFDGIGVETPDEKTVVFTLSEPFAPFTSYLTLGILPAHLWDEIPPGSAPLTQLNLKPVGSGPYQFEKLTKDSKGTLRSLTLKRNPDYYRGAANIKTLTFKFFTSTSELSNLLRNRNIEGAVTVPFDDIARFSDDRSLNVVHPILPQYTAAFFNLKSSGVTSEPGIKRALSIGTDRQVIVNNILKGKANALVSPLFSGTPGGVAPENVPGPDINGAITAIEAAGYKIPEGGGPRKKGDKVLALTLTYANSSELTLVAQELERQWELLGFDVTLNGLDSQRLQEEALKNRSFEVLLAGELYGTFRDPYPYWHSSQGSFPGLNITQFTNRAADDAITTIRTTPDEEKRSAAYGTFAGILAEQVPAVFLYQPTYTYVTSSDIKGVNLPNINLPADRFADITDWYIKTKSVFKKQ
jgi:peptide/nickel transport system substrate-binding protein